MSPPENDPPPAQDLSGLKADLEALTDRHVHLHDRRQLFARLKDQADPWEIARAAYELYDSPEGASAHVDEVASLLEEMPGAWPALVWAATRWHDAAQYFARALAHKREDFPGRRYQAYRQVFSRARYELRSELYYSLDERGFSPEELGMLKGPPEGWR